MNASILAAVAAAERADRIRGRAIDVEPPFLTYTMTADERSSLVELAALNPFDPHAETGNFLAFLRDNLNPSMLFFRTASMVTNENMAAVVINGGPVGVIGPTPQGRDRPSLKDRVTETLLGAMSVATGMFIVTFPDENTEALHNIRPELKNRGVQTGTGSGPAFRDHNEVAFADGRPDLISLCCLRGHPQAGTTVASVSRALAMMNLADVTELRQPQFRVGVPPSFRGGAAGDFIDEIAVVSGPTHAPMSRVNFAAMSTMPGASADAMNALEAFELALRQVKRTYYLTPGSVLLINNHYAVHGRTAFEPVDFGPTAGGCNASISAGRQPPSTSARG